MKYMTKEWYETTQKTDFHIPLRVSKKADVNSDKYFNKLYKTKEKELLKGYKKLSNMKFDYVPMSFNPMELKKRFEKEFISKVMRLIEGLPDNILHKVADIRVLALGHATGEVKEEIAEFCKENREYVDYVSKAYLIEYERLFNKSRPDFIESLDLYDCVIKTCRKRGNDIVLKIDNSQRNTETSQITLKNCSIIKQDAKLNDSTWIYEEIYPSADGYEIHVLLRKDVLIDFIFTVTDIEYK